MCGHARVWHPLYSVVKAAEPELWERSTKYSGKDCATPGRWDGMFLRCAHTGRDRYSLSAVLSPLSAAWELVGTKWQSMCDSWRLREGTMHATRNSPTNV